MNRLLQRLLIALIILTAAPAAGAVSDVTGDWHGVLETAVGKLALTLTIADAADGTLNAELESPDQAPGRKIPIAGLEVTGDRLAFTVPSISARYDGTWVEAEQHWSGYWEQGARIPLAFRRAAPPRKPVITGMDGTWEGKVTRNDVELRLILRIRTGEQGTVVRLDSPDLAAFGLPVEEFVRDGVRVRFLVPASGARYEGTVTGERMTGPWTMPGRPEATVTFVRTGEDPDRAELRRPQTPEGPFDYRIEDVRFDNPYVEGMQLAGTLTLPSADGSFPAVVLISGSGPQDRDATVFGHKPFAVLADHLTRHGVAVLRCDDRGTGASTGNHNRATSADFAMDARAAVRWLERQPWVGAVGLVGHSEGGMIAPIAAAEDDGIDFIVMLAGPGTGTRRLMQSQTELMGLSQGVSEEDLVRARPVWQQIADAVTASAGREDAERRVEKVLTPEAMELLAPLSPNRQLLVQSVTRDWFRYLLRHDPAGVLERVHVPVLAINGSLDVQVPARENLAAIAAALRHNPDVTVRELDGLNHLFQTAGTGALGEYRDIEETFAPAALDLVTGWILERFTSGDVPGRAR